MAEKGAVCDSITSILTAQIERDAVRVGEMVSDLNGLSKKVKRRGTLALTLGFVSVFELAVIAILAFF